MDSESAARRTRASSSSSTSTALSPSLSRVAYSSLRRPDGIGRKATLSSPWCCSRFPHPRAKRNASRSATEGPSIKCHRPVSASSSTSSQRNASRSVPPEARSNVVARFLLHPRLLLRLDLVGDQLSQRLIARARRLRARGTHSRARDVERRVAAVLRPQVRASPRARKSERQQEASARLSRAVSPSPYCA